MIPLSERITLELRHRNPKEVTELILDTSKADKIEGLTDEYVNLKELSLVNVGLKSLIGFPKLPNLENLDLSDNMISGGLDYLTFCPKLTQLLLTSNRIGKLELLHPLTKLQNLKILDLCNSSISEIIDYRESVFNLLPQLVYLDGYDQTEAEESETEYYEDDEYDDYNEDLPGNHETSGKISGKKGKYCSMLNYQAKIKEREYVTLNENYNQENAEDTTFVDMYDPNYAENNGDVEETEEEVDEDDYYSPPTHGSKFRPNELQSKQRSARKRSYSSSDEYESTWKVYIRDSAAFVPTHD